MRFSQNYVMDGLPDPNGMDQNFIYANSLYRPDNSDGTLRNALGYHNWGQFYEKYVIVKAHIRVQFTSQINGPVGGIWNPLIVGVQLTDSQDNIPTVTTLIEQRACKTALLQSPANGNIVTLNANYYAAKWHGVKNIEDVETLDAEFIINQEQADDPDAIFHPPDRSFFRIFYQAAEVGTDPTSIQANCLVTYTVLCKDPRNLESVPAITPTSFARLSLAEEEQAFAMITKPHPDEEKS